MNRGRHTNSPNPHISKDTGIYIDSSNQMILFDDKDLPLLVNPNKPYNSYARKIQREVVRQYIHRRYGI